MSIHMDPSIPDFLSEVVMKTPYCAAVLTIEPINRSWKSEILVMPNSFCILQY